MKVIAYLNFPGTCEEAFRYYEKHLGGKVMALMHARGTPMEAHSDKDFLDKVMHACMEIDGHYIMASDAMPEHYEKPQGTSVMLGVDSVEEAERVFAALSDGGRTTMDLQETFWSERFGCCVDRFGTPWMVNGPDKGYRPDA